MVEQNRVLIVDDDEAMAWQVADLVMAAGYQVQVMPMTEESAQQITLHPPSGIVLRNKGMSDIGSLAFCRALAAALPQCPILMYGHSVTADLLYKVMEAGARRFLSAPLTPDAVSQALLEVTEQTVARDRAARSHAGGKQLIPGAPWPRAQGHTVTVFSPKGGVGCSTVAVNLAVSLQLRGKRTVLVDANLGCGNVTVLLGMTPSKTVMDIVENDACNNPPLVYANLMAHKASGLDVLLAPTQPEQAERISAEHMRDILTMLQMRYDYVVIDTASTYNQIELLALEMADTYVVPVAPDMAMIKNLTVFMRRFQMMRYNMDHLLLVLTRANSVPEDYVRHIESSIGRRFDHYVVSDGPLATTAINNGNPLVLGKSKSRIAQDLMGLLGYIEPRASTSDASARNLPVTSTQSTRDNSSSPPESRRMFAMTLR